MLINQCNVVIFCCVMVYIYFDRSTETKRDHRGCDRITVGFTTMYTYAISAYHH